MYGLSYLLFTGMFVDSQAFDGTSALIAAVKANQEAVVSMLINVYGARVDLRDQSGRTALVYAALAHNEALVFFNETFTFFFSLL